MIGWILLGYKLIAKMKKVLLNSMCDKHMNIRTGIYAHAAMYTEHRLSCILDVSFWLVPFSNAMVIIPVLEGCCGRNNLTAEAFRKDFRSSYLSASVRSRPGEAAAARVRAWGHLTAG